MVKKITALCACIVTVISMMAVTIHAEDKNLSEEAISILTALNIITQNEAEDFSQKRQITRAEFCVYLARALNLSESNSEANPFVDIGNSPLSLYIDALYKLNIVSGYNNTFRPDDWITYNEAVKMVVCAANYEMMVKTANGTYPDGYLKVANDIGITENLNISNYNELSKEDAACLIFNMLSVPVIEIKQINQNGAFYTINEDKNMLASNFDVYKTSGTITKSHMTSVTSDSIDVEIGEVLIDGKIYNSGDTMAEELIGCKIEFYYLADEDNENYTILYVTDKYDTTILEVKAEDIIDFTNGIYSYYEDGKTKSARLDDTYSISYNNSYPQNGLTTEMMLPKNGKIKLIKSGNSNGYNFVFIEDYKNYIVNGVDAQKNLIYVNGANIQVDENEDLIFSSSGNRMSVKEIKTDDIISVLYSSDNKKLTIYVSDRVLSGKITAVSREDTRFKIFVDGKEYTACSEFSQYDNLVVGNDADIYLDYMDMVVYTKSAYTDEYKYAYLIKTYGSDVGDDLYYIKTFTQDGEIIKEKLSDKIKINNISYKNNLESAAAVLDGLSEKLIKIKQNSDGDITRIITCTSGADETVNKLFSGNAIYNTKQRGFGGKVTMAQDAKVFVIPSDDDERDYQIESMSVFSNDTSYNVSIYTMSDNIYGEVILRDSVSGTVERKSAVITKIDVMYDEDDGMNYELDILWNGSEQTFRLDREETLAGCEQGDIIQFGLNNKNEICNIVRIYDCKNDRMVLTTTGDYLYEPQSGAGYRSAHRMYMGYAYVKKDGVLRYGKDIPTMDNLKNADLENALLSGFSIYVIDRDNSRQIAYIGDESAIYDFERSGMASKIIVSTNWNDPEEIYIIK